MLPILDVAAVLDLPLNAINDFMVGYFFSFIIYYFQKERFEEHYPLPIFVFALHLEWTLNLSTDKKSNAIFILANLCSTLFSLWFKFSLAWFYFLSKCAKRRGQKLTGKNLNVDRQFFKDIIGIF